MHLSPKLTDPSAPPARGGCLADLAQASQTDRRIIPMLIAAAGLGVAAAALVDKFVITAIVAAQLGAGL